MHLEHVPNPGCWPACRQLLHGRPSMRCDSTGRQGGPLEGGMHAHVFNTPNRWYESSRYRSLRCLIKTAFQHRSAATRMPRAPGRASRHLCHGGAQLCGESAATGAIAAIASYMIPRTAICARLPTTRLLRMCTFVRGTVRISALHLAKARRRDLSAFRLSLSLWLSRVGGLTPSWSK